MDILTGNIEFLDKKQVGRVHEDTETEAEAEAEAERERDSGRE